MQYVKEWPIRELAAGRASVDLGNRLLQTGETDLDDIKDVRVRFAR